MEWILANLPLVIVFIVIYSVVSALKRAQAKKAEHEASQDESAEQRRVREIQERIRRVAAERRGGRVPADMTRSARHVPDQPRETPPPLDPFPEPVKRMLEQFDRRIQPTVTAPPLVSHSRVAEVERQEQLADEMHALEDAKMLAQRRAAHVLQDQQAVAASRAGLRTVARAQLLADLRDPHSLRRAFVLREVLGPPVGLR